MRTNDQWFQPGDKVMRVCTATSLGHKINPKAPNMWAQFGKVYCVESCVSGPRWNTVYFVGAPVIIRDNGTRIGWYAACFRKVEEIKLCVAATQKREEGVGV